MLHYHLARLDDEIQGRNRGAGQKRLCDRHWLSADRMYQLGHYGQLLRELRMEESTSFINSMRINTHVCWDIAQGWSGEEKASV